MLLEHDPHITVITETWLNDNVCDSVLIPPNYSIFRCDRPSRGGGVAIVLRHPLTGVVINQIDGHESLFLRVNCWGHVFIVCAVYRPPSASPEYISKLCDHMAQFSNNRVILAGDFNIPCIDWRDPVSFFDVDINPLWIL